MVTSCDNKLQLQCPGPGEMIVVRAAAFTPLTAADCSAAVSSSRVSPLQHNNRDILLAVIKRCNGVRGDQCEFDLQSELAESASWGSGRVEVRY